MLELLQTEGSVLIVIKLKTLHLGESDGSLLTSSTDDEDVGKTSGKSLTAGILQMDDILSHGSLVHLNVSLDNASNTALRLSSGNNSQSTHLELEVSSGLSTTNGTLNGGLLTSEVDDDGIMGLHVGVGEAESATIMSHNLRDTLGAQREGLDAAELELTLDSGVDLNGDKAALGIVKDTVGAAKGRSNVKVGGEGREGDDVHKTQGELAVKASLSVNEDRARLADKVGLSVGEAKSEAVSQKEGQGEALTEGMGTLRGTRGIDAGKLVQKPVGRSGNALQMLLWAPGHDVK